MHFACREPYIHTVMKWKLAVTLEGGSMSDLLRTTLSAKLMMSKALTKHHFLPRCSILTAHSRGALRGGAMTGEILPAALGVCRTTVLHARTAATRACTGARRCCVSWTTLAGVPWNRRAPAFAGELLGWLRGHRRREQRGYEPSSRTTLRG